MRLCGLHNLYFYNKMKEEMRVALDNGCFTQYKKEKLEGMNQGIKQDESLNFYKYEYFK